jgi:hypothetical protein
MRIEKQFSIAASQQAVWGFITSPERVAPCIPGCERVESLGDNKYRATIRVQVGPIDTRFDVEIETTEQRPPDFASYVTRGEEGGRASRVKAETTLALRALAPEETLVTYAAEVSLVGRLGRFGSGLVQKKADSIGEEFLKALRERIAPAPVAAEVTTRAESMRTAGRRLPAFGLLATRAGRVWIGVAVAALAAALACAYVLLAK